MKRVVPTRKRAPRYGRYPNQMEGNEDTSKGHSCVFLCSYLSACFSLCPILYWTFFEAFFFDRMVFRERLVLRAKYLRTTLWELQTDNSSCLQTRSRRPTEKTWKGTRSKKHTYQQEFSMAVLPEERNIFKWQDETPHPKRRWGQSQVQANRY